MKVPKAYWRGNQKALGVIVTSHKHQLLALIRFDNWALEVVNVSKICPQDGKFIGLLRAAAAAFVKNEIWQSIYSTCISIINNEVKAAAPVGVALLSGLSVGCWKVK